MVIGIMSSYFCISFRFLDSAFHGLADGRKNEWPPSPLRVFQSMVAASAARQCIDIIDPALRWLEQQPAPTIIAPEQISISDLAPGYCLSVPNNSMDIVANAWCRGNYSNHGDANPATHRTMKTVRPILLPDSFSVHYLWLLSDGGYDDISDNINKLSEVAKSVVALGWGLDMAVAEGRVLSEKQANELQGERWIPSTDNIGRGLRMPVSGTLDALLQRHERFLKRMDSNGFVPPSPLSTYTRVEYRQTTDPMPRKVAAFSFLKPDASGFRAFETIQMLSVVSGMMRHATSLAAERAGWSKFDINTFVLGHGESKNAEGHIPVGPKRFAYLPLPSIESRRDGKTRVVGNIRRVLITSFADVGDSRISWARRALSGQDLVDEKRKESVSMLSPIPLNEKVVQYYTRSSASWSTVTPVILPGYDDPAHLRKRLKRHIDADEQKRLLTRLDNRIDSLLRKAITQAGFSKELADNATLEWRKIGFWAGTELADKYRVPQHLKHLSKYHVRIQWRDENKNPVRISGPICIGGGRFYGVGLFAAESD
ncbi:MAG: type I-U CRISPR-associated protein Cas5/Cas6 [Methanothrix sp.]|nr:type I-U CRISPR-associated protein Cas5/Cas6 [Methanothrix sp.]